MHWYWIDRFTIFESGTRAQAIKAISRGEDHLSDHFHYHPVMPASLMIEGLAQTAGLLIHETHHFQKKVVLGKIPKFHIYNTELVPGDTLIYDASIEYIADDGSMASVQVHRKDELIADGTLVFAHLGQGFMNKKLFNEGELEDLVRVYGMYDIGVQKDGTPIVDPEN